MKATCRNILKNAYPYIIHIFIYILLFYYFIYFVIIIFYDFIYILFLFICKFPLV